MNLKPLIPIILFVSAACSTIPGNCQDSSTIKSLPLVTVRATTKKIPDKIWKGFSTYFSDAENPRWYKINKDYLAKYMIYDEENRALFTKKGKLVYHISYGYEKSLPDELLRQIKTLYSPYDITRAIRINEAGREIWVVTVEDEQHLVLLRLEGGDMDEIQSLKKSG